MNAPVTTVKMTTWAVDAMGGPLLERLVYLARFGPPLIVVTGDPGPGSEGLCDELAARLNPARTAAAGQGTLSRLPAAEVTAHLAVEAGRSTNSPSTILVPDADSLPDGALAELRLRATANAAGQRRVVLFGTADLANRLPDAHHECIPGLDEVSARTLLRRHLPGWAVSSEEVERTLRKTGGAQNETAQAFSQAFETRSPRIGLPVAHMAGLVMVAGGIAALLMGLPGLGSDVDGPVNLPVGLAAGTGQASSDRVANDRVTDDRVGNWTVEGETVTPPVLTSQHASVRSATRSATASATPSANNEDNTASVRAAETTAPVPARRMPDSVPASPVSQDEGLTMDDVQPRRLRSVRLPRSDPLLPASAATLAADTAAGMWSLQVLVLSDQAQAARFVRSRADPENFQLVDGDGKTLVVNGRFPDKAAARESAARLPADLRELGPWPRLINREAVLR